MSIEHTPHWLPDWARRERQQDFEWIRENLGVFMPAAFKGFQELGRGALVVNTLVRSGEHGHPIAYFPQAVIVTGNDEDLRRMVREYNPADEFVILLLKTQQRTSTYRVQVTRQPIKSPASFSPS